MRYITSSAPFALVNSKGETIRAEKGKTFFLVCTAEKVFLSVSNAPVYYRSFEDQHGEILNLGQWCKVRQFGDATRYTTWENVNEHGRIIHPQESQARRIIEDCARLMAETAKMKDEPSSICMLEVKRKLLIALSKF